MRIDGLMKVKTVERNDADYEQDGIMHCGDCREPKKYKMEIGGVVRTLPCMCKCESERFATAEAEREARERFEEIQRRRAVSVPKKYREWTFANDKGNNPDLICKAQKYVSKWEDMRARNIGLLLWGDVGTGKSYAAACIANALMEQYEPVLMESIPDLIARIGFDDPENLMGGIKGCGLLVLDDLGAGRETEFSAEMLYRIIDQRYTSGRPVIITTNRSLAEIKNQTDITYKRSYDRVMEMCVPIKVDGESLRVRKHNEKKAELRAIFEK